MKYKFITIEECNIKNYKDFDEEYGGKLLEPNFKKKYYTVINNKSHELLGIIHYYPDWKKYVWEDDPCIVWDEICLQSIINFLKELNGNKEKARSY